MFTKPPISTKGLWWGMAYTVGAAGGWNLGDGHSSLSPQYGLGVDSKFSKGKFYLLGLIDRLDVL